MQSNFEAMTVAELKSYAVFYPLQWLKVRLGNKH